MRTFLAPVLFSLLASLPGCAAETAGAAASVTRADALDASALHTFTSDAAGFDTHSFWLDTGREVVVFDAQFTPDHARALAADIQRQTKSPIRWVVVTHPNPDKFNGAPVFQALGAKVVASRATAAAIPGVHAYKKGYFVNVAHAFTEATYPAEPHVDVTFEGSYVLPLAGGARVELRELAHRGVSSTQTVGWVPAAHALVVGDLVHHGVHAWLEGGIVDGKATPDLPAWKAALDELAAWDGATVYGGRGEPAAVRAAIADEQAYLDRMDAIVTRYVASAGPLDGPDAGRHWAKLTELAHAAFPGYGLDYLVTYGVYGLAAQRASRLPGK